MTMLSIWMPSHASFERSLLSVRNVYELSRIPGVEAVVSDNSGDPRKSHYWLSLSDKSFKYLLSPFTSSPENAEFAIKNATGDHLCFLSDDDQLIALPGFDPRDIRHMIAE